MLRRAGVAALLLCLVTVEAASPTPQARFLPLGSLFQYVRQGVAALLGSVGGGGRVAGAGDRVSYRQYQVLRLLPQLPEHVQQLEDLGDDLDDFQFWTPPVLNRSVDVMLPPDAVADVKERLADMGLDYVVLIPDVQKAIASVNPKITRERRHELKETAGHEFTFKRFHRYADMMRYLQHLARQYPHLVELLTIGRSAEGLPIRLVRVSSGGKTDKHGHLKPAVWIDGGTHAREWISPAVALFVLRQLVEKFSANRRIVEAAEWFILPVLNPDGYEYSHTTDRLWRKNRSSGSSARWFFSSCEGVDLNRNYNIQWGRIGSSDDPCAETYAGRGPFSEPETKAVSDFIMDRREKFKIFLTLHSYAQMWLMPWGYTSKKTSDYDELLGMGRKAVDAIHRATGIRYKVGTAADLMSPASGGADDWAKAVAGIKYVYTVELRDTGDHGFLLPASQIVPTGKETFAAIKALVRAVACKS